MYILILLYQYVSLELMPLEKEPLEVFPKEFGGDV